MNIKNSLTHLIVILSLLLGFGSILPIQAELVDKLVARIGSDIILLSDIKQAQQDFANQNPNFKDLSANEQDKRLLAEIVNDKLIDQDIRKRSYEPSQEDVESNIAAVMQENGFTSKDAFRSSLRQQGLTYSDFEKNISKQLARSRLINWYLRPKIKSAGDKEALAYLKQNQSKVSSSSQSINTVNVCMMFLPKNQYSTEQANNIQKSSIDMTSFVSQSKIHTQGPKKDTGGCMGEVAISDLREDLHALIKSSSVNKVSEILTTQQGYFMLWLKNKSFKNKQFDDSDIALAKQKMESQALEKAFVQHVSDLRRKAKIKYYN